MEFFDHTESRLLNPAEFILVFSQKLILLGLISCGLIAIPNSSISASYCVILLGVEIDEVSCDLLWE